MTVHRLSLTHLDLFTSLMNLPSLDRALSDGLHLGRFDSTNQGLAIPMYYVREGHAVLYQMLSPEIEARLRPGLKYPEWREMDNGDTSGCYSKWKVVNQDRV